MLVKISFSCFRYPFVESTTLGIKSYLRWRATSILALALLTSSSFLTRPLYEPTTEKTAISATSATLPRMIKVFLHLIIPFLITHNLRQ